MAMEKSRRPVRGDRSPQPGDALKQFVVDKVVEKVGRQAAKHPETAKALAPVARDMLELWTREAPGSRRPRFSLDEIAAAGLRIVDEGGIEALSMRRLASELDAGTMTLYHYIRTKDELLALVGDAVMGELIVPPDEFPSDWRTAMVMIANRSRSVLERHPWMFEAGVDPAIGPNGVRHFDQSLQAVSSLDIPFVARLDIISAVDEYVFGYALHSRNDSPDSPGSPDSQGPGASRELIDYVVELSRRGGYPQIAALLAEHGVDRLWAQVQAHNQDTSRFDRNLNRLLDGIERDLPKRRRR